MLLTVDIGNTNIVCGLYEGQELGATFRLETGRTRTEDEQAVLFSQLLALYQVDVKRIHACILASVVPQVTGQVAAALARVTGHTPLIAGGPGLKTGLRIRYDNPREVGADRIVNSVAAAALHQGAVIVVDFGTATTFDCISSEGEYIGGVIVPGVQVSLDGLVQRAAKLSRVDLSPPPQVIGRNTTHAMQSGILYGYASMVDGLVEKIALEMGTPVKTIATGGLAGLICRHTRRVDEIAPALTLEGLRLIYERNAHNERNAHSERGHNKPGSGRGSSEAE